ncbi:5'-nucleotidase, lipoprotein e(P4) family [Allofrancisella guangzhouensis]|uniref:HAD family hydrolase n=1 Tax=Allofrancisella guangzhouensis TaxID=594679 RepID=A0A0A8E6E2_9GAMM|nr:HAD family acid phosphatase [Allofrancisella guangzhouensis]AJC49142.1 HAD family hydrolase [Allofrancisella guangzhouensis]MBK2026859.1 5'-nucleotidase, lipoprotein e(P4) family [Allofrancisella guangzhouensis]MBK2043609.1 5'-nucleotidase, lipoprotein e(P4) family [Allofrancisella guangzhouensis]MBK2046356.1 5'-nucleotidase, lipoprotein e(P4) family [Allofrancisella guangzhouensis]
MKLKKIILVVVIATSVSGLAFAVGCNPNVDGVKWYHDSSEKKALYYQTYDVAAKKIKHAVKKQELEKGSWGVILDIDETALDNSWAEYNDYKNYQFSEDLLKTNKAIATPGAVEFTHMIHDLGGYVSFVTNRNGSDKEEFKATVKNLKKENIYFDQVLFSNQNDKDKYNKNQRFKAVESGKYAENIIKTKALPAHKVIAYFGDNIQDFPTLAQKSMQEASQEAYENFGSKYFIMPNPMYGSWQ